MLNGPVDANLPGQRPHYHETCDMNHKTSSMSAKEFRPHAVSGANAKHRGQTYMIEGEQVTINQMAERLGVNPSTASYRHAKLRKLPGAITWEALRA